MKKKLFVSRRVNLIWILSYTFRVLLSELTYQSLLGLFLRAFLAVLPLKFLQSLYKEGKSVGWDWGEWLARAEEFSLADHSHQIYRKNLHGAHSFTFRPKQKNLISIKAKFFYQLLNFFLYFLLTVIRIFTWQYEKILRT